MENLIIREAKRTDIESIVELLNTSPPLAEDNEPYNSDYILHTINNPINIILVGEIDSIIYGALIAEIWKEKRNAYISNMITHEKYKRNGVSVKLYNHFESLCKTYNIENISFIVKKSNNQMQDWSKKNGFEKGELFYFFSKKI